MSCARIFFLATILLFAGCSYDSEALDSVACDTSQECGTGAICTQGYCVAFDGDVDIGDIGDIGVDAGVCEDGKLLCDGECVDPYTDRDHCGECGNHCHYAPVGAQSYCNNGTCSWECEDEGYRPCSGECVNFDNNVDHCGGCGQVCEIDGGQAACDEGVCALAECDEDLTDCSEYASDGEFVCTDRDVDPEHCGECGVDCSDGEVQEIPERAVPICDGGKCNWECEEGYWDCGGECVSDGGSYDVCDGVCVDLDASHQHCGNCDAFCTDAETCYGGQCVEDCPGGEEACEGSCVNTQTDVEHCGDCGDMCEDYPANASPFCDGGNCDWECNSGYELCNGECIPTGDLCADECDPDYPGDFGGGEGTTDEPYLLCATEHLADIGTPHIDAHFRLDDDIAADSSVEPIGNPGNRYNGTFDGNGHTITGLHLSGGGRHGLFRFLDVDGVIIDLQLDGIDIEGGDDVGALVGVHEGRIENVSVEGTVMGEEGVGGLVGRVDGSGQIEGSYASGTVSGEEYVGGLVGRITSSDGGVLDSYATSSVDGEEMVGGLIGRLTGGSASRVYASGSVEGDDDVGALVGKIEDGAQLYEGYWDSNTAGVSSAIGTNDGATNVNVSSLSTNLFDDETQFGFDFSAIWTIGTAPDGQQRPILRWQDD